MRPLLLPVLLPLLVATAAGAQPKKPVDPEAAAIKATALDDIEGWYEGNVDRMQRAVHPELVKRIVATEAGASRIENMGATKLVANVRAGFGKKTPKEKQQKDVTILDRYQNAATVKVVASDWIDYLHVAKLDGRWQIVNVLWERKPELPPTTTK